MKHSPKTKHRYLILYFQVHQPRRLRPFSFFDMGNGRDYFDDDSNSDIMRRIAHDCYLPTNLLLLSLIQRYPNIRIAFSISGIALKQMERFAPAVIESFKMLAATGNVEFLSETYYHSMASLISRHEFEAQVDMHREKISSLFNIKPSIFRNTELIYSDDIGQLVSNMGFQGIIIDGHESMLKGKSAHYLYQHPSTNLNLLLRDYSLSDDIAFRFNKRDWVHWPLTPTKFVRWMEIIPEKEKLVTVSMDYETFGEHQKAETGIFRFLDTFLRKVATHQYLKMVTPSQAIKKITPVSRLSIPHFSSWADQDRDLSAWLGNEMQQDAFDTLKQMEEKVKSDGYPKTVDSWRHLQTSDHLYYMSTKVGPDGEVHNYFSPYSSPYDAFMNYMNVLNDFASTLEQHTTADLDPVIPLTFRPT